MDVNTYKALSFYLGIAVILMPVAVYVIQLVGERVKNEEKRAIINSIPGGLQPQQQRKIKILDDRSKRLSFLNAAFLGITLISGLLLFHSSNEVQDKLEEKLNNISGRQISSEKKEDDFEKFTNNRFDYISKRIKGNSQRILTESQKDAFKTLESLSNKQICLVQVGGDNETSEFFKNIDDSISSFDANIHRISMGRWTTFDVSGNQMSTDEHNQIQVYDPEGESGSFYKAIKETGLPTNLIGSLPLSCKDASYGLVIGKNT
ncbi:hypothetical protein [Gluconobacter frateurii]|uniref:Uncharacterized protein n=1 Tax=Gluconobacter frateurii NRIC 0228 TaxID=1307946 RepID=A0ABQ0QE31_9PROT|nr:hypothetical protein [Gluconobacter frateurii]GBR15670.1 hypothetical protein AA0228_2575 [Gluconobacter frateurii NRIC 0228]GLP90371.1 hypothetical protein GCM10007868_14460 [Gluconobacter frateurii]